MGRGSADAVVEMVGPLLTSWLADAEISFGPDRDDAVGLSVFLLEEAANRRFVPAAGLSDEALELDARVRGLFDVGPRYWTKLHYRGLALVGYSLYFSPDPRLVRPATMLRGFVRAFGAPGDEVADILEPALDSAATTWGLALKRRPGLAQPRVVARCERAVMEDVMARLVGAGRLDRSDADRYALWARKLSGAGEFVYVGLDPAAGFACGLDFERVPLSSLPFDAADLGPLSPAVTHVRYLKGRIRRPGAEPSWTAYLRLSDLSPAEPAV